MSWHIKIVGIVDNDQSRHGTVLYSGNGRQYTVMSPDILKKYDYDRVIITTHYHAICRQLMESYQVPEKKIADLRQLQKYTLDYQLSRAGHKLRCMGRKTVKHRNGEIKQPAYVITPCFADGFRHQGIGQMENHVLAHCIYAAEKGWIPIVDMKNYSSMYQKASELGRVNIWERYYQQPSGYSLEDLPKMKKVLYSVETPWIVSSYRQNTELKNELYASYIKVRSDLKKEIDEEWERLTGGTENVLGCVCRGTDVIGLGWENNYPSIDAVIEYLDLVKDNYDKIYLATEDQDMYERITGHFGSCIAAYGQQRYRVEKGKYLIDYEDRRENGQYLRGREYLFVLEMLSRCAAVTGMIGTAVSVACMKNPQLQVIRIPNT